MLSQGPSLASQSWACNLDLCTCSRVSAHMSMSVFAWMETFQDEEQAYSCLNGGPALGAKPAPSGEKPSTAFHMNLGENHSSWKRW